MPDPNVMTGPNPAPVEPTQDSATPDQLQAPAPAPAQQPMQLAPSAPPQASVTTPPVPASRNQHLHNFVSSTLSAIANSMAGKGPVSYSTDPNTGRIIGTPIEESTGDKLRRIGANALSGLAAGAQVPQQKSGLAAGLAGLGAGAAANRAQATAADDKARKNEQENAEAEAQKTLRKYTIAHTNALTYTTYSHDMREEDEHDPQRKKYAQWADAAEQAGLQVQSMTAADAKEAQTKDPSFATNHLIFPAGFKPQTGPNGEVLMDPKTGQPLREGQVLVIQGGHMTDSGGQVVSLPSTLVSDIYKYGDSLGITNAKSLKAGDEVDATQFFTLINKAQEGNKKEQEGWLKPQITVDQKTGKTFEKNSNTGEVREAKAIPTGDVKNLSDASRKDESSEETKRHNRAEEGIQQDRLSIERDKKANEGVDDHTTIAEAVRKGRMDPSQLSKRSKDYNAILAEADRQEMEETGKHFNIAQAQTDYKFANNVATQNTLKYLNSLTGEDDKSGNLGELVAQSNKINRTSFPPLNDAEAWSKLNLAGDASMAAYYATVTEVADQVAKILQGGGSGSGTSDAKLVQAQALFNQKFTKEQVQSTANTLRTLLGNRKKQMIGNNRYLKEQFSSPATSSVTEQQSTSQNQAPAGASSEVYSQDGKTLIGHIVNNAYVPVGKQ